MTEKRRTTSLPDLISASDIPFIFLNSSEPGALMEAGQSASYYICLPETDEIAGRPCNLYKPATLVLRIEKIPFPENDLQPQENIYACFILQTMKMKYL